MQDKKEIKKIKEENLKKKKEFKRARDLISGIVLIGAVFSLIIGFIAGDTIFVKKEIYNPEVVIEESVMYNDHEFSWGMFFLAFFATFVPVVGTSIAANTAIDCIASVTKNEDEEQILYEDEKRKRENEKQKKIAAQETNKILDEAEKE